MKCTKMEGCGNDFILIDEKEINNREIAELAKKLCNRHYGIGADGLIVVKQNPLEFIYYNSDGSSSPFCGNGMRCFAKYCRMNQIVETDEFAVICSKWKVHCEIKNNEVTVTIPEISMKGSGYESEMIYVCGSKHKVIEVNSLHGLENTQSNDFNLNFVKWNNEHEISIKTIERGAGLTLACGSGSVASAWKMNSEKKTKGKIVVHNLGGDVIVDVKSKTMTGPANLIFMCEINENALK